MIKKIDIQNWNRKEHFEFFSKMKSPYFGITAEVECTFAYKQSKANNFSFFSYYLHKSMIAVNKVENLKLRIIDNEVVLFDTINAGTTVMRKDETFGFAYAKFTSDFKVFSEALKKEIESVHNSTGLRLNNDELNKDLIRHSVIPWMTFTGLLHPTNFEQNESVPKIIFGKLNEKFGKKYLPVSIEANHALADGIHFAKYFEEFQKQLNL